MISNVQEKLRRSLPAFLNPDDSTVSVVQSASQTVLEDAESTIEQIHQILSFIGATDTDLDVMAGVYGIPRLVNETDAHYQQRVNLLAQSGSASPTGIQNLLNAIYENVSLYEPAGGSVIGWNMRQNFRYDRSNVSPTFTRNSSATFNSNNYTANQPVFDLINNQYYFVGVFPANGYTGATSPDVLTIPAQNVIGTQSQGMIAIAIQDGAWGPQITSDGTYYPNQYLLDYDGTFSCWFDGQEWHWLIGGVTLSGTVGMGTNMAHLVVLNWWLNEAQLIIDGQVVASATVTNPPTSVSGNVYIGSDHTGANQISAFLGNFAFLETGWPLSRIQSLEPLTAIPIYAQTLFSGAFFTQSITGIEGGMINSVSNYVGVYVPSIGGGFALDQSALDNEFLTDSQTQELNLAQTVVFPLFKGGSKLFLWQPGSQT